VELYSRVNATRHDRSGNANEVEHQGATVSSSDKKFVEILPDVRVSRRSFTKLLGIGLPAVGLLSACAGPDATQGSLSKVSKVGLVTKQGDPIVGLVSTQAIEFFNEWNKGAKIAASALGLEWQLQVDEFDPQKSISIMNAATAAGTKMFATSSLAPGNEPLVAATAQKAGAKIIQNYNAPDFFTPFHTGPNHIGWLVPDEILAAEQNAIGVIEAAGGSGNFVHLTGDPTTPVDWRRTLGVDNALKRYPGAKLVARSNADWDRVKAQRLMADFIIQTGGKIDGVFTQNDDIAIGALAAMEEKGLKVPMFGMDGVKEALDLVRNGSMFSTSMVFPTWIGGYNVVQVFDAMNGFVRTAPERMMYWASPVLTLEGKGESKKVNDYKDRTNKYDWELMSRVLHPNDWDPQNDLYPMDPAQIWATREKNKPAGWVSPVAASIKSGEFESIKTLYKDHYKTKVM
jgi:ribose transport system substrate-binding protein